METVLITGASRGIGLELTRQFLALGYSVISTYRGQPSMQLKSMLVNSSLTLHELEVTDETSIANLASKLSSVQLDILINNAGVIGSDEQSMEAIDPKEWLNTFAVNSIAPLMVSRALLGLLETSANPRIITVSSQMGALNRESYGMYAYRSSKAAVNKVMQVLALELKPKGIVACPIHPGWVKTDMGGKDADITVEESASGIVKLASNLTLEQSGKFLTWQGAEHVW
ncbi:SDR family oxidoreductase [Vibrio parahaemolyticus]|uniref:SDR family oxidoreductase n=1 Tax=Vibrio parahaemolyticus TaxID=670 RepID=UPI0022B4B6A7|nr:SDR family oxidoreductase [Vibrio parahaemolyticus]MCZ6404507.1 SDR family oxidoreductase [Vibrio parahaemolyticus]